MRIRLTFIALLCLALASSAFAGDRRQQPPAGAHGSMSFEQFQAWLVWNGGRGQAGNPGSLSKSACDRILRRDVCSAASTCQWFGDHCGACTTGTGCRDTYIIDPFSY
jgi:hypothetical protein